MSKQKRPPRMRDETPENPHLHTSGGDPDCNICVALIGMPQSIEYDDEPVISPDKPTDTQVSDR